MNYTELKSAIVSYAKRADLAPSLDTFISFFESHINTVLRVADMETNITATPVSGLIALPADYLSMRQVKSGRTRLEYVTPDKFLDYGTSSASVYTIVGNVMQPNTANAVSFTYYQQIPALSVANLNNWLLSSHPDAYLYGCLAEAALFTKSDPMGPMQLRDTALTSLINSDRKARWSGTPLRIQSSNRHVV